MTDKTNKPTREQVDAARKKSLYRGQFIDGPKGRAVLVDLMEASNFLDPNPAAGLQTKEGHSFLAGQHQLIRYIFKTCGITAADLLNSKT